MATAPTQPSPPVGRLVGGMRRDRPAASATARVGGALSASLAVATLCLSCGGTTAPPLVPDEPGATRPALEGEQCGALRPCEDPLVCARTGLCATAGALGTLTVGAACQRDEDCLSLLVCGAGDVCVAAHGGSPGDPCDSGALCRDDLLCASDDRCRAPGSPGTAGVGEPCSSPTGCRRGLVCGGAACLQPVEWAWEGCPPEATEPLAYFRVPRPAGPLSDFYHLPFPNELRLHDGQLDLEGHPDPGRALPVGAVGWTLAALGAEHLEGFSPLSAVTFRLSTPLDWTSVRMEGADPTVLLWLLDPAGVEPPRQRFFGWRHQPVRGAYHCGSALMLRPGAGWPLRSGAQAAVVLLDGLRDRAGQAYGREPDLTALLAEEPPAEDETLQTAHTRYAPLRVALAAAGVAPARVVAATLFSVRDPLETIGRLASAALTSAPAELLEVHECSQAPVDSPCRALGSTSPASVPGCPSEAAGYTELLGRVRLPSFRAGSPPFVEEGSGGVAARAPEALAPLGAEDACFSLTLPAQVPQPVQGWDPVVFAHAAGGHARSAVLSGVAARLAGPPLPGDDPAAPRLAVLSVDAPGHGLRTHGVSPAAPRLGNPVGLRGERLQWIADLLAIERWVGEQGLGDLPGAPGFDPERLTFVGHGEGASAGVSFLAHAQRVRAAALLGGGGDWTLGLLETRTTTALAEALLAEAPGALDPYHPVLGLLQQYLDPIDPASLARHVMLRRRDDDVPRKHLYLLAGLAPAVGHGEDLVALVRSLGLEQASPSLAPVDGLEPVELPAVRNIADYLTAVFEQFEARDVAPEAALLQDEWALRKLRHFLATAAQDPAAPTVPR